jgi:transposase
MAQMLLPIFPSGSTPINNVLSFEKREGWVYYFYGCQPVFHHQEDDLRSFRMFTSQLYLNGSCKQSEIVGAFGVTPISVKRWVKKYREGGPGAFYHRPRDRKPHVLTEEVINQAQQLLDEGKGRSEAAEIVGVKADTLYRAVASGKLKEVQKKV